MDDKESTRTIYGFENGDAFDLFYDGLINLLEAHPDEAVALLDKSIVMDKNNQAAYLYRVMAGEVIGEHPDKLKGLCVDWVAAAKAKGIERYIEWSNKALKFYDTGWKNYE